jgi:magnesium chelatase family protein
MVSENRDIPFDFRSPVRRVHAQVRPAHLLGSFREKGYQPGELALAHGGLFIADEFMEWPRDSKETLREPLQTQKIFLTRIRGQIECEASFQMIATGNLCPCGGLPEPFRGNTQIPSKKFKCKCKLMDVEQYFQKLSGPVLDRIDLSFIMTDTETLPTRPGHPDQLEKEIKTARAFAVKHFGAIPSQLSPQWLEQEAEKSPGLTGLLADVTSLRARHKIMRVARSIQALENSLNLKEEHLFEAKWYRLQSVHESYS